MLLDSMLDRQVVAGNPLVYSLKGCHRPNADFGLVVD